MKKILSILFVLTLMALATPGLAGTLIGTYNQTYADPESGGSNIWTSVASVMYVWANDESQQYFVINTTESKRVTAVNLTLQAGPVIQGALGDLTYTLDENKTYILGPFETSRFKQANETIQLTFNDTCGKILCIGTA